MRSAAARLGVSVSTAYAWLRAAANAKRATGMATTGPSFVELVPVSASATGPLVVRVGVAEIEVRGGFDAALLRAVVTALAGDTP